MTADAGGIGVLTLDRDGRVESWNRWLESATGLAAAAVRGRAVGELAPPRQSSVLQDVCADVIAHGLTRILAPAIHGCVIACPPRQPSTRYTEMQQRVTVAPLRGDGGIVGAILTVEDVTGRLESEHDLAAHWGSTDWRLRVQATRILKETASREQVAELIESLAQRHHDFSVLSGALVVLVSVNRDVVEPIIQLLGDSSPNLRMHAALALGAIGDGEAVGALVRALDDDDVNVRFHAIESLGRLRAAEALEPLCRIAAAADFFLAFPAIDAMAKIEDPSVVPLLTSLLTDDTLRPAVIDALASLGDEDVVPTLVELLNRGAGEVGALCAALRQIYERYERTVGDGAAVVDIAGRALSVDGAARVCEAIRRRQQPLGSLATVGGWIGEPAIDALVTVLDVEDVTRDVAAAFARIGRNAVPALIDAVSTGDRSRRIAAAPLLGAIGDRRATVALAGLVSSHDTELVIAAVSALAALGDPDALDAIVELFAHPDVTVRQGALAAVHSLGDRRVRKYAQVALASDDGRVREAGVRIAGYFGFDETAAAVLRALRDPSEDVRRAAIEQVALLDDPRGADLLLDALRSETPRNRAAAAHALRSIGGDVEAGLIAALADPDTWVRYFAAGSLGARGARAAAEPLARVAEAEGPPHLRIAALEALTATGPELLRGVAYPMLADPDEHVAAAAVKALAYVDDAEADARLEDAIRGPHGHLRLAAAAALTARATPRAVETLEWAAQLTEPPALSGIAVDGLRSIAMAAAETPARAAVTALVTLGGSRRHRDAVVDALGALASERIAWLAELYRRSAPEARVLLVGVCARLHHPDASALVVGALADEAVQVRLAAVAATGRIGAPLARHTIVSLAASDPSAAVRYVAAAVSRRRGWTTSPVEATRE